MRRPGVVLGLLAALGCSERVSHDPMETEDVPAELLEAYEEACEARCEAFRQCFDPAKECDCEPSSHSDDVLCFEKTVIFYECLAALTCDELEVEVEVGTEARNERCFGQEIAKIGGCLD